MERFQRSALVEQVPPAVDCAYIQGEISQARDRLLSQWQNNGRQVRSFEPEFDRVCYVTLGRFKDSNPEAYFEAKKQLDSITETNLKTTVGERLNASLSQWEYDIKEDGIYAQGTTEKAIEMYRRGRNFRRIHGKGVDFAREEAELDGFSSIDDEFIDGTQVPEGTMWISFSPRGDVQGGSIYSHNFYDILTVKKRDGKHYIESRRYASALTPEESIKKITQLDPEQFEDAQPTAEYLLANPIKLSAQNGMFENADELHSYLHKNIDKVITADQFEFVLQRIKPAISEYLKGLNDNPNDSLGQLEKLRGVLNSADATVDMLAGKSGGGMVVEEMRPLTAYELVAYRQSEVKPVQAGCGFSGDYGGGILDSSQSVFSVAEFGADQKKAEDDPNLCKCGGERPHFHCPGKIEDEECNRKIIVGQGIKSCPSCGEGKRC